MEDGELIASWSPGQPAHVLVLEFQDPEDMIRTQERLSAELRGWTSEGERFDKVRTTIMTYGSIGRRTLMNGQVVTLLVATTEAAIKETEAARREWSQEHMLKGGLSLAHMRLSEGWTPTTEQEDWFDKWSDTAVEADPAGRDSWPRIKTSWVRGGFNAFVSDHNRPDLVFKGTAAGRAFSALMQSRFRDSVEVRYQATNAYYHGIRLREGAKRAWFSNPQNS